MRILRIFIYWIVTLTIFSSCKKKMNDDNKDIKFSKIENSIDYYIKFPDTVNVNDTYNGEINYISHFDSIINKFGDKKKNRYVFVSLTISNNLEYDITHLKSIVTDTFGAIDNRVIPIHGISFPNKGIYYIDGVLNDAVFIDLDIKDENGEKLIRWIEDEMRVTKKVVVIDKE